MLKMGPNFSKFGACSVCLGVFSAPQLPWGAGVRAGSRATSSALLSPRRLSLRGVPPGLAQRGHPQCIDQRPAGSLTPLEFATPNKLKNRHISSSAQMKWINLFLFA